MNPMMEFVIGWTLVCAFVFTVIITCLSLVGWVKFVDSKQQTKLFQVLVVELVVGAGARVLGVANFNPVETKEQVASNGANTALRDLFSDSLERHSLTRDQASAIVDRIHAPAGTELANHTLQLREEINKLPAGQISPEEASKIAPLIRNFGASVRREQ